MSDKYKIKTYQEYINQEISESDSENNSSYHPFKKSTYGDNNNFNNINFNQNILTKERYNFEFHQSEPKNRIKKKKLKNEKKNKRIIQKTVQISYDSDILNQINVPSSYNPYTNNKNLKNKILLMEQINDNNNNGKRINLNKYFDLKRSKIREYKTELNVEKNDNFNVLSYRPEEYESDYYNLKKNLRKQEASELFLPSKNKNKRAISHMTYAYSTNDDNIKKNKNIEFQKQNYYFNYKGPKKIFQARSTSKFKANQLNDFNIEKLIEIGDNKGNKWKSILSFGKKIQDIRNNNKNRKKKLKIVYDNTNRINPVNFEENEKYINTDQQGPLNSDIENKKFLSMKKVVYHGQIKRKKNIETNRNQTTKNSKRKIEINNNMNKTEQNIPKNNQKINKDNTAINNNISSRISKSMVKQNIISNKEQYNDFFYQSQNNNNNNQNAVNNHIFNKISPKKSGLNGNKFHYSVKKFDNMENDLEKKKKFSHVLINEDKLIKKDISKNNLLTEKKDLNFSQNNAAIKDNKINMPQQQNVNINKTKDYKKAAKKEIINKRYYGFDDRHNLEGNVINNHTYYESVYSKKSNKIQ